MFQNCTIGPFFKQLKKQLEKTEKRILCYQAQISKMQNYIKNDQKN